MPLWRRLDHIQYDIDQIKWEYEQTKNVESWYDSIGGSKQLALQSYKGDPTPYKSGCGSMKHQPGMTEYDYYIINSAFNNGIFSRIIAPYFRARFMTMIKHSTYSVHKDKSPRLHLAIDTHPHAYFFWPDTKEIVHIPADGYVYWVDTTENHTFVNAGPDRTHLVMVDRSFYAMG
jgi:hypothetical protein